MKKYICNYCGNEILKKEGWIVYRIAWNDLRNNTGKKEMKGKIDKFLKFYNNCV